MSGKQGTVPTTSAAAAQAESTVVEIGAAVAEASAVEVQTMTDDLVVGPQVVVEHPLMMMANAQVETAVEVHPIPKKVESVVEIERPMKRATKLRRSVKKDMAIQVNVVMRRAKRNKAVQVNIVDDEWDDGAISISPEEAVNVFNPITAERPVPPAIPMISIGSSIDGRARKGYRNFDDVISRVGSTGEYQKRLLRYAISPMTALQPILVFNAVFMLFTPQHWCIPPDFNELGVTPGEYKFIAVPLIQSPSGTTWDFSSCLIYEDDLRHRIPCPADHHWDYSRKEYQSTWVSAHDFVCDYAHIPTYVFLAGTVGNAFGMMIFGLLSDNWGRKPTLFLALLINVVFRFLSLLVGSRWVLMCFCQFFVGSTTTALYVVPSLLAAELCKKEDRAKVYAVTWTVCLVGLVLLPFIAWMCGHWYLIGFITAIMGLATMAYFPVIQESPRWLLQKGKVEEAAVILEKVQKFNIKILATQEKDPEIRHPIEPTRLRRILNKILVAQQREHEEISGCKKIITLFTSFNLAKNTILLTVCWSMNTLIYNIMTYNATHMNGSHFKNFGLLGVIEIPSGIVGGFCADIVGRRWTQTASFFLCALCCVATAYCCAYYPTWELFWAITSKLVVTVSFLVVYCQATELFPTELRSTGGALASTVGNFISIAAPVIAELGVANKMMPWVWMAGFSVAGTLAAAFIPETLNLRLPETVEEANNIGKMPHPEKVWDRIKKLLRMKENVPINVGEDNEGEGEEEEYSDAQEELNRDNLHVPRARARERSGEPRVRNRFFAGGLFV